MHNQRHSSPIILTLGLLTAVLLPSCSLPPGYAWRQIQRDGLIPFIQNGMSAPKAQTDAMLAANTPSTRVIVPASPPLTAPLRSSPYPPAYAVIGLNGYVRTPFTNPPRLVDVRGMTPGTKVTCPYTQRQFVVPGPATPAVRTLTTPQIMAQTQPRPQTSPSRARVPAPTPLPAPVITSINPMPVAPKFIPAPSPTPSTPKVAATPQPKRAPAPTPVSKPKPVETPKVVAATPPPSKPEPKPAPTPTKTQSTPPPIAATPPAKLPFGAPITGRPGFVNSPFAEKHQLVDVTGLSVGTEVKCPYTGKLFRVPPQQQAKN